MYKNTESCATFLCRLLTDTGVYPPWCCSYGVAPPRLPNPPREARGTAPHQRPEGWLEKTGKPHHARLLLCIVGKTIEKGRRAADYQRGRSPTACVRALRTISIAKRLVGCFYGKPRSSGSLLPTHFMRSYCTRNARAVRLFGVDC